MKVLIIEDEAAVAKRLSRIIGELEPGFGILSVLESVEETVEWLNNHAHPDLLFMDVQLADGLSFEIFDHVQVNVPVIFTTAFNNYAIRAFKVNSVDYLLKPINKEELRQAIEKFKSKFLNGAANPGIDYSRLSEAMKQEDRKKHARILVRYGQTLKAIEVKDIACFYTDNKTVYLHTFANNRYPIDERLDALGEMLDPLKFFRLNRSAIINFEAIDNMYAYSKSRVNVELKTPCDLSFTSSSERSAAFKDWLSGKL
jgi:DNA-binding LytR/AlgR family response regulator